MRAVLAAAVVMVAAQVAPAQYTIEAVSVTGPVYGFFGGLLGYKYPNDCVVGYNYTTQQSGLLKPDNTFLPCPVPGTLNCVSNAAKFVGGLTPYREDGTGLKGFRWNTTTGAVEYLDAPGSGWAYASPAAVADDGAAVVTGSKDNWFSAGTWKVGTDKVVYVPCQPTNLPGIAGWYLQGAYYLEEFGEVNGVKQYTLYGRGWSWATWMSGYTFRMYGPMPE